jgi:hypothetical protein
MIGAESHRLLEFASTAVEQLFRNRGKVFPMYHVVKADGAQEVIQAPPLDDKDAAVALMRAYFELFDIKRYVFVDEAWSLNTKGMSKAAAEAAIAWCHEHGVTSHPRWVEEVIFVIEDEFGLMIARRRIERPEHGKARLGPLTGLAGPDGGGRYEGRMVGLLPRKGRMQ